MMKTLALCGALTLPLIAGGCSSMMHSDDTASASTVSRDSQGQAASATGTSMPASTTHDTAGPRNQ